jgi:tRNA threonylcarbamoyladenosine biosynthesis protein TsaE
MEHDGVAVEPGIIRRTHGAAETRALGRALGEIAAPGTVVALTGPLGAGKTQLAKGVAQGLEVESVVNSPTFVLMNEHEGRLRLFHIDAYRLDDPEEAFAAGLLDEREAAGVTVIEWADRRAGWLPAERLDVRIWRVPDDDRARLLELEPHGSVHARLAASLRGAP